MTLQQLLDYIDARIKQNGNREITAPIDNDVRKAIVNYFADLIGDLSQLNTSSKNSVVEAINAILSTDIDLSNYIQEDKGIELAANKELPQYTGNLNDLKTTGFWRGYNLTNEPIADGTAGPSGNSWKIYEVFNFGNDIVLQRASNIGGGMLAWRMHYTGLSGWGPWQYLLDNTDLTIINNSIASKEPKIVTKNTAFNKNFGSTDDTVMEGSRKFAWSEILDKPAENVVSEIDLNNSAEYNATTKSITIPSRTNVLKLKTSSTSKSLTSISFGVPAVATYTGAQFITEGQSIKFSGITGGPTFTALNTGTYIAKNVNIDDGTFEIYESDGTTPYNSYGTIAIPIINMGIDANDFFLLEPAGSLDPSPATYIIHGAGWELSTEPGDVLFPADDILFSVTPGTGSFTYKMDYKAYDTNLVYLEGGDVYKWQGDLINAGSVSINGNMEVAIDKAIGLPDGREIIIKAAKNIKATFNTKPKGSAAANDIIGSSISIIGADKGSDIVRMLRDDTVNLIYGKQTF